MSGPRTPRPVHLLRRVNEHGQYSHVCRWVRVIAMSRVLAAPVNLNRSGHYLHWGVVQISVANLTVIVIMVVLFVLALLLPFPTKRDRR